MKDDMETRCLNELFGKEKEKMITQIYTKTAGDYTSIVVSNDRGNLYFEDVLEVPELTGIQRGASFVKHHLDSDKTEIYPDKVSESEIMNDAFIRVCRINPEMGNNPHKGAKKCCESNLQINQRWIMKDSYSR